MQAAVGADVSLLDDVRVIVAIITAAAAFVLWVLKTILDFARSILQRRNEVLGIMHAFKAEFETEQDVIEDAEGRTEWDVIIDQLRADASFVPFVTVEDTDAFGPKHRVPEIRRLPAAVQGPVIRAYRLDAMVDAVLHDMQSDRFAKLSAERKIQVLENLKGILSQWSTANREAVMSLDRAIGLQKRTWRALA